MAILIIAFLTVTIAAAYAATSAELSTNLAQKGETRAFMLAQAGLENFMARRNEVGFCANCGLPPAATVESTTVSLPGGYAQVVAQRVRVGSITRPAIYLLRSRGVDTVTRVGGSSLASNGERIVAQLVYWNVNQVNVLSGWTSLSGLNHTGAAGSISGIDSCGVKPTVAGIAVPTGTYSSTGGFSPAGSPPVANLGTQAQANASAMIDWAGIVNGNRIQPDFTFANNAAATAGWPAAQFAANPNFYPAIRVNGDLTLPSSGRGTLIVTGNLIVNGFTAWDGIVLVGGTMTSNGNGFVQGATISGLNELLGLPVGAAQANGTKTFQYNSCQVAKAAAGLASYSVYPNAWMDNFVTY